MFTVRFIYFILHQNIRHHFASTNTTSFSSTSTVSHRQHTTSPLLHPNHPNLLTTPQSTKSIMSSTRSSHSLSATERRKKETHALCSQIEDICDDYEDRFGKFDNANPSTPHKDHQSPPESKFTKTHFKGLDNRCKKLHGKLFLREQNQPLTTPSDKEEKEFNDLDAESYVLGRVLAMIVARDEWLASQTPSSDGFD